MGRVIRLCARFVSLTAVAAILTGVAGAQQPRLDATLTITTGAAFDFASGFTIFLNEPDSVVTAPVTITSTRGENDTLSLNSLGGGNWSLQVFPAETALPTAGNFAIEGLVGDMFTITYDDGGTPRIRTVWAGLKILTNTDFENAGVKDTSQWTIKSKDLKDKVKCDKPGKPVLFSSSPCALMMKGGGAKGKVVFKVPVAFINQIQTGDQISVTLKVNTPDPSKFSATIDLSLFGANCLCGAGWGANGATYLSPNTYGTMSVSGTFDLTVSGQPAELIKMFVSLRDENISGKTYVDDINVVWVP